MNTANKTGETQLVSRTRDTQLISAVDRLHRRISAAQRELFALIAEVDAAEIWREEGARDTAHWLGIRYGISNWKANRWIKAAHVLPDLPRVSDAFTRGEIGIDKVVELTRFASPETERDLIRWAARVSVGAIRRKADLAVRAPVEELADVERARFLSWWYLDEGKRFGLEAELPAAQGAIVARAIERLAETSPVMPDEEDPVFASARRADALVMLCSGAIASDPDPDRATVVIHAQAAAGTPDGSGLGDVPSSHMTVVRGGGQIENGPAIHPETLQRLLCDGRLQTVLRGSRGRRDRSRESGTRAIALDAAPTPLPRSGVRVPRMRCTAIHSCPPCAMVAQRRPHGPRQLGSDLLVPSSAGSRARLVTATRRRRNRSMVPSRRTTLPSRPTTGRGFARPAVGSGELMVVRPSTDPPRRGRDASPR